MILSTVLSVTLMGQGGLPGSDKSLEQAIEKSRIIVVAELQSIQFILGSGPTQFLSGGTFKTSEVLMGAVRDLEMTGMSLSAQGAERLPREGEACIYFLDDYANHLNAVKVLDRTEENIQAVNRAVGVRGGAGRGPGVPASIPGTPQSAQAARRLTEIIANADLKGEAGRVQAEFARAFCGQSPQPAERLSHFKWLDPYSATLWVEGWRCHIRSVERQGNGEGWIVTIVVSPVLNIASAAAPLDRFTERYEFSSGRLHFIDGEGPLKPYRVVTFN